MDATPFRAPINLHVEGAGVEIDTLARALAFLREWPVARRGPVYRCAINSCEAALVGSMSEESARAAFESFARITGILAGRRNASAYPAPRRAAPLPSVMAGSRLPSRTGA